MPPYVEIQPTFKALQEAFPWYTRGMEFLGLCFPTHRVQHRLVDLLPCRDGSEVSQHQRRQAGTQKMGPKPSAHAL